MKQLFGKVKQITLVSVITMIIWISTSWITGAFMNEATPSTYQIALWIYSFALMAVFALVLIYWAHVKKSDGEEMALEDFRDGYWGIKKDLALIFGRERMMIIALFLINMSSWVLISLDKLIFAKRTVTVLLLVYAPLNTIGTALPLWLNSVLGYVLGSVFCAALYLLELVLLRRKWYRKWQRAAQ